ncbi:hypothetical protein ACFPM3_28140 [Streptomyces coeruleoprunus]|uniref:Uncharacterized protein n=1 Tax=Streptomyces coeruleoprunus TaxID=285563 RepID=A0ABV9XP82_9ACTN
MGWDEWEQLKAEAAARGSTQMRLNQHGAGDGGGAGGSGSENLRSDKRAWAKAGEGVKGLGEPVGKALTQLSEGQTGLGETAGCQSAAAQKELYESWQAYVKNVRDRCTSLSGLLEAAGHDLSKTDASLKGELEAITARYKDTEAVGGQAGKGR